MTGFRNLVDLLQSRGVRTERGITHILGDQSEVRVTYRELYNRALQVLGVLQQSGLKKGDELVFQIESNEVFLDVFWACLMGGIVPVPISVERKEESRLKVFRVWRKLNRPWLVSNKNILSDLVDFSANNDLHNIAQEMNRNCILSDQLYNSLVEGEIYDSKPDDLAFIQFSSGSTGNPKGVMLTHDNLLANISGMVQALGKHDPWLSWMPLTHDMGLIACHLSPLFAGADQYIMPTALFVRRPTLWLQKASEHRAKVLASPNFGYKYFLLRFKPNAAADWDLSNIEIIINGAEPISTSLCEEFLDALEPFGLKRTVMNPGYGLAEASVCVSLQPVGESFIPIYVDRDSIGIGQTVREMDDQNHPNAITLIDEGFAIPYCDLRICDDNNSPVGQMVVGHIQIKGRNVTKGYYNDPVVTESILTKDGWLDTGDLGFIRDGRLVVTGRVKDVIFVEGQNYYCHDIERVVEQIEGLDLGKVAVCGVYSEASDRDEIIVFIVSRGSIEKFAPLVSKVKHQVGKRMGLPVKDVIPINSLPKTTSGKIQRYKLEEMYRAGQFQSVLMELNSLVEEQLIKEVDSSMHTERALLNICQDLLGTSHIGIHHNFSEFGVNSSLLAQIHARIDALYPGKTTMATMFSHPTIAKLARFIDHGGSISLPRVALPETFFEQVGGNRGTVTLQVTFDGNSYHNLTATAAADGVTPDIVLLSVYVHLLSEVTGDGYVNIQALVGPTSDQIVSLELNLNNIEDFTTLYQEIVSKCSGKNVVTNYSVRDIGKIKLYQSKVDIIPLFYNKQFLTDNIRLLDIFDITIEVNCNDSQVTCIFEFDSGRLRKEKMIELLDDYLDLVNRLLEQSVKSINFS